MVLLGVSGPEVAHHACRISSASPYGVFNSSRTVETEGSLQVLNEYQKIRNKVKNYLLLIYEMLVDDERTVATKARYCL